MKCEIVVPQIGEAISALRLAGWRKAVGDPVKKGEVLFEVDSDKAIVEVESIFDGTLAAILAPADSEVMPNQVVAVVETHDEAVVTTPIMDTPGSQPSSDPYGNGRKTSPVAASSGDAHHSVGQRSVPAANDTLRVNASPKARRLARETDVNLRSLRGTGVGGMIRAGDVERAASARSPEAYPAATKSPAITPLSKARQTVALRTQESKQTVPHFYLLVDVDMTEANRLRDYCRSNPTWDRPPTYTDLLIRVCALALADLPAVNQSYSNGSLVARNSVNIGVAVDTDAGLLVPIIAGAHTRSLRDVSLALRAAAERARKGVLTPSDLGEKSMIISNLGMYSVDTFIAIIDQPDPMILAVGRVADRIVPLNGQPGVRAMCTLTLSVDHRVLDGAQGARFLERVKNYIENPYELMGQHP